jgi:hypothetical protein
MKALFKFRLFVLQSVISAICITSFGLASSWAKLDCTLLSGNPDAGQPEPKMIPYTSLKHANPFQFKILIEDGVKISTADAYLDALNGLNRMIDGHLNIPKKVTLLIGLRGDNAYHENDYPDGHILHVVEDLQLFPTASKHPFKSIPVTLHEHGHGILEENLMNDLNFKKYIQSLPEHRQNTFVEYMEYGRLLGKMGKIEMQMEVIVAEAKILEKAGASQTDPRLLKLTEEFKKLREEHKSLQKSLSEIGEVANREFSILAGYHEFFADLLAVIYTGNKRAIYDALWTAEAKTTLSSGKGEPASREHTKAEKEFLASVEARRFDRNFRPNSTVDAEAHDLYAIVRDWAGDYLIDDPKYMNNKGLTTKVVFDVINILSIEEVMNPQMNLSPKELNMRFIHALEEAFKANASKFN